MTMLTLYICPLVVCAAAVLTDAGPLPAVPLSGVDRKALWSYLIGRLDTDKSGDITLIELELFLKLYDTNKDGIIVKLELSLGLGITDPQILDGLYVLLNVDLKAGISLLDLKACIKLLDINLDLRISLPDILTHNLKTEDEMLSSVDGDLTPVLQEPNFISGTELDVKMLRHSVPLKTQAAGEC